MDDYMVAIINGGKDDGNIEYLGFNFNFKFHALCLIDYALKKYPQITGFQNINYMEEPNLPVYYLSLLNNIIFTNISVDDFKRGMLYLPKNISDVQKEVLYEFIKKIVDYDVLVIYNMSLADGMVVGETLDFNDNIVLEEKLNNYFKKRRGVCKNG